MSFGPKFRMGEPIERAANDSLYDQRKKDAIAGRIAAKNILKIQKIAPYIPIAKYRNNITFS